MRGGGDISEKEVLISILRDALYFMSVEQDYTGSGRNGRFTMTTVDNPYYMRPLFINFRYNVYSSDWPMANRMVEAVTGGNTSGDEWLRRMNGMSEDEKALFLLGRYGFDRVMSNPDWEDLADNALSLKTRDFFAPASEAVGYEALIDSIIAHTREREFANISFDSILSRVEGYSGIDLQARKEEWNGRAQLACYKIGSPTITNVVIDTADVYQAEIAVENISDNPGYVTVQFEFWNIECR